jgi:uncharacterized DUF497 family protein
LPDFQFKFEWDPRKALSNLAKHGVAFAQAATVLLDPLASSVPDDEHSEGERRWVTLGLSTSGQLLIVIHTFDEAAEDFAAVRIISARSATPSEMRDYEEGTNEG